ncbi:hypothetical protein EDF73_101231 [Raoultella sp. BIGb0138]|uniref:hypothetical protein n=1 Tax=Raoultella sp. BIGb0138 TaxID=2485115 RepID=UPI00104673CB|nr:hypothetical protein [Raoultella sp. BIGb0138]TCW17583.1 hypothetical protein EDF73_101231 [Raoultella sp. BIGb0138]
MKKKSQYLSDFQQFKHEVNSAILATTSPQSCECLTRARVLSYLLCRNMAPSVAVMLNDIYDKAVFASTAAGRANQDLRAELKNALYQLEYRLSADNCSAL